MKTITVKGKVYEIGKLYGSAKGIGGLCGHSMNGFELRKNSDEFFISTIYPVDLDAIGTIKDAPIELEDGEWYMCEYGIDDRDVFYCDGGKLSIDGMNKDCVKPLHKMIKA